MRKHNTVQNKITKETVSQEILSKVVEKLKITRQERQLTQADISKETGFSTSHLSRLENGSRRMSLEVAIKLCLVLDISLDEIIELLRKSLL